MAAAAADGERRIGVAMDYSESAKKALDWAIDNLLHHGDTLVVLHVLHHGGEETKHALWAKSGSPLIPLSEFREAEVMQGYGVRPDAEVLDMIDTAARQKQLKVVGSSGFCRLPTPCLRCHRPRPAPPSVGAAAPPSRCRPSPSLAPPECLAVDAIALSLLNASFSAVP